MTAPRPLNVAIHDSTCRSPGGRPGLSHVWRAGGLVHRALGHLDACRGAASWAEALDWLANVERPRPIGQVQFWGHGRPGQAWIAAEALDVRALLPSHPHHRRLVVIRDRLVPGGRAVWWFRTCETFAGAAGHAFARDWSRFLGCRVAGHTHGIAFWQSGLHALGPDEEPSWSIRDGFAPDARTSLASGPRRPNTTTCLAGSPNRALRRR